MFIKKRKNMKLLIEKQTNYIITFTPWFTNSGIINELFKTAKFVLKNRFVPKRVLSEVKREHGNLIVVFDQFSHPLTKKLLR
jgi:hypothetical protein